MKSMFRKLLKNQSCFIIENFKLITAADTKERNLL